MNNGMLVKVFDKSELDEGIVRFKMKYNRNPKLYMSKETMKAIWNSMHVEFTDDEREEIQGILGEFEGYEMIEEPLRFEIIDLR